MVMRAQPVVDAVEAVQAMARPAGRLLFMTPRGRRLRQDRVRELAGEERLVLVCGRYEGFDERIFAALQPEEVSIGDYVLTGGELPAMVVCDAVVRLLPGVLGDPASPQEESFEHGLLDHPHYTQPAAWRGRAVPEILRSGHHERVRRWRAEQARASTRARRPDLLNAESETTERDEQPQGDWPPEAPAPQEPGDDPWTP
jgi:tRNA (guanine37-N1)-methyltransferase